MRLLSVAALAVRQGRVGSRHSHAAQPLSLNLAPGTVELIASTASPQSTSEPPYRGGLLSRTSANPGYFSKTGFYDGRHNGEDYEKLGFDRLKKVEVKVSRRRVRVDRELPMKEEYGRLVARFLG